MGYDKFRRKLWQAGSVDLGADCNLYRDAANKLKTDDGLAVGGTPFIAPYSTSSPTLNANGQIAIYHKGGTPWVGFYIGGTPYVMQVPTSDGGTPVFTVNSTP
jgi:hypothetical protein